jgi:hypothetical protein
MLRPRPRQRQTEIETETETDRDRVNFFFGEESHHFIGYIYLLNGFVHIYKGISQVERLQQSRQKVTQTNRVKHFQHLTMLRKSQTVSKFDEGTALAFYGSLIRVNLVETLVRVSNDMSTGLNRSRQVSMLKPPFLLIMPMSEALR